MRFGVIPLAKWHLRPPQHIQYCQPSTLPSAAVLFTPLGAGNRCPGSEEPTHPVTLLHQWASLGFTTRVLCAPLRVSPFLRVALHKLHRQFRKN